MKISKFPSFEEIFCYKFENFERDISNFEINNNYIICTTFCGYLIKLKLNAS